VLTEWWFWASLPLVLPLMFALDWTLSRYNRRYWQGRGQEPPPRRASYLDAGRFVLFAAVGGFLTIGELVTGEFVWAAAFAGATALFGLLALHQARRNVI
jgi:hypothetical protein